MLRLCSDILLCIHKRAQRGMYAPSQFGNDCGICNRQGRADIEKEEGEGPRNPEQKLGVLILG